MANEKFKLPRKQKKRLKKVLWLYPPDENGNSLMASPAISQEDYLAFKKGILRNLFDRNKSERVEFRSRLNKKISVSNETLREYVDDIFSKEFRSSSFDILVRANNSKRAVTAYYNFVNAYEIYCGGEDSYGNICCMAVDSAKKLLRGK